MSKGVAKFLAILFIVLVLIEIFGNMIVKNSEEKKEIEEQFDHYELKDHTPEEEQELISRLYPDVEDEMYVESMMYAFNQSILIAKSTDNYDIFSNNVTEEYLQSIASDHEYSSPGELIYIVLTKNMTPTKSAAVLKSITDDIQIYSLEIYTLEKGSPLQYEFRIRNKKIIDIKESE